jgi:hypothetical protein
VISVENAKRATAIARMTGKPGMTVSNASDVTTTRQGGFSRRLVE